MTGIDLEKNIVEKYKNRKHDIDVESSPFSRTTTIIVDWQDDEDNGIDHSKYKYEGKGRGRFRFEEVTYPNYQIEGIYIYKKRVYCTSNYGTDTDFESLPNYIQQQIYDQLL